MIKNIMKNPNYLEMFFKYFSGNFTQSNKNFIQCLYKVNVQDFDKFCKIR
jgi:hypothetical protein